MIHRDHVLVDASRSSSEVAGWPVASGLVWINEWLCSLIGMSPEFFSTIELDVDMGVSKI